MQRQISLWIERETTCLHFAFTSLGNNLIGFIKKQTTNKKQNQKLLKRSVFLFKIDCLKQEYMRSCIKVSEGLPVSFCASLFSFILKVSFTQSGLKMLLLKAITVFACCYLFNTFLNNCVTQSVTLLHTS